MHKQSFELMAGFVKKHLNPKKKLEIVDIGSQDVNGCYKDLFKNKFWTYTGVDIEEGKNVDVILLDSYKWFELGDNEYDVVICGQTLEHTEYPWEVIKQISRIMKVGGICCIIAPQIISEHKVPVDCWRFMPDGMRTLAKIGGLAIKEIYDRTSPYEENNGLLIDTVLVAVKVGETVKSVKSLSYLFDKNKGIRVDLGAGTNRQGGYITVDKDPTTNPDIVWDLQSFPYPIPDNICHVVLMSHIYEHIEPKYRVDLMNEVWRISKDRGQVLISTPYYQSFWASQDPMHYPCANEATFTYFDPAYDLYKVYKPKPWHIVQNNYTLDGNVEVIMEKFPHKIVEKCEKSNKKPDNKKSRPKAN